VVKKIFFIVLQFHQELCVGGSDLRDVLRVKMFNTRWNAFFVDEVQIVKKGYVFEGSTDGVFKLSL
jgi:hypothetical protein